MAGRHSRTLALMTRAAARPCGARARHGTLRVLSRMVLGHVAHLDVALPVLDTSREEDVAAQVDVAPGAWVECGGSRTRPPRERGCNHIPPLCGITVCPGGLSSRSLSRPSARPGVHAFGDLCRVAPQSTKSVT